MILCYTPGTCAMSDVIVLQMVGQPYKLCRVDREQRFSDAYKRINERSQVPAAIVDGRVLTENAAILLRIAGRPGVSDLVPELGSDARDDLNRWLSYLDSGFHIAFYPYFKPSLFTDREELFPHLREFAQQRVKSEYEYVDRHLNGRRYFLGDRMSVLDPYIYVMGRWGQRFLNVESVAPNLHRLMQEVEQLPATQFALAIESGDRTEAEGPFGGHVPLEDLPLPD